MDNIRPVLRALVVVLSFGLMIAYIVVSGRRQVAPSSETVTMPATAPAALSGEVAATATFTPNKVMSGSKSANHVIDGGMISYAATQPSVLFSTSKSKILFHPDAVRPPQAIGPATQPAGN